MAQGAWQSNAGEVSLSSGDKGDIVVADAGDPGETWTLDTGVVTAFSRTVLDDTTAAAWRTTLGAVAVDAPVFTSQVTFDGSQIVAPHTMVTNIIRTDKSQNNEPTALGAAVTWTLSATPTANTWFSVYAIADSAASVVTLPVAATFYSLQQGANITAFTIPAGKRIYVNFVYTGSGSTYFIWNEPVQVIGQITFSVSGGGLAITTGEKAEVSVPYNATILSWTLIADQSGSIVFDLWKDTYANYPPTVADTITAAAKPTLSAAAKNTNSTLTGWTKTITAGDILKINIDSASTVTRATLVLTVEKT